MARMSDDGPLVSFSEKSGDFQYSTKAPTKLAQLPMHNLPPQDPSTVLPPAYTPPSDPNFYSRSESPSKPLDLNTTESGKRNKRNACICMGIGMVMFIVVPAAVFGGIISQAHTNCVPKTSGMTGDLPDGQKFC
ncbi:hypothetical protein EG329_012931 [Mollisiaceae sp. DMI_Dod_QoI]|nr:hypothetical protein EG329_012931 [Helotiales sp. DMI_Dod_QoI]